MRRDGAPASRALVETRLAGERECCTRMWVGRVNGAAKLALLSGALVACSPETPALRTAQPVTPASPNGVHFGAADPEEERMSLVRILATPQAVDGRSVFVVGYLHLEFEGRLLCLHKEDVEHRLFANCIWTDIPKTPEVEALSDHYVGISGKVNARAQGHMGMYQATVEEVRRILVTDGPFPSPPPVPAR
jgi:hypothetical protein